MRVPLQFLPAALLCGLVSGGLVAAGPACAQAPDTSAPAAAPPASQPVGQTAGQSAASPEVGLAAAPSARQTITVPAGTKVLLQLRSSVNTKSAKPGDGVYLASIFPVVVGSRVVMPVGLYVQGVVDRVERAGHVKGKAELDMHFTSIIFPNNTVVEIPGVVDALPGAKKQTVKDDQEGTITQDGDKGRNVGEVAKVSVPVGGTVGAIGGLGSGHPLAGGIAGVGAGLAAAGLVALFTRGADVSIDAGTQVEMVLQRPLLLEEENLAPAGAPGTPATLAPSPGQPRPIGKPGRTQMICPPGGLGCS